MSNVSNSSVALRCQGLVKRFDDVVAVDGLDLEVRSGECFGLLGPNGAGKTTSVEILEGIQTADEGTVEVLGQTWEQGGQSLRERMGIQLQETQLSEKSTVMETIQLFRSFYSDGLEPEEVLAQVSLQEKRSSWVRKLSGGQKQRLSLACALVCNPEVLFLDEPTTGLDPQSRLQIWDLVGAFRDRGGTVLLTTHYMDEAHRLCDRLAIVDRGKVIAGGTPDELIDGLEAKHMIELEVEGTLQAESLAGIDGVIEATKTKEGRVRVSASHVHRAVPAILEALRAADLKLTQLSTHHATLEDVFVSLTGRQLRDG